jgi:large subunit ribosomal protein L13
MVNLTKITKPERQEDIKRKWHLVDMSDKVLGREATNIASLLIGKHKINYVPYLDSGDYVVVINASKVKVTGKKRKEKVYTYYSGYPGGLKEVKYEELSKKKPAEIVRHCVSGMLPKNKLRKRRITRLYIYADENHPHLNKFS